MLFSGGTYQVEVKGAKKQSFWPFVHLDDAGNLLDSFCTCPKGQECSHITAARARIFNRHKDPLHVRFRASLWHHLCAHAARSVGYEASAFTAKKGGWEAHAQSGKLLVRLEGLSPQGKASLKRLLFDRPVETEETSLKFSHLPPEELQLWRENRPSAELRFELSFWSDLAKEWMLLQEAGKSYELGVKDADAELPHWLCVRFGAWEGTFYISDVFWPTLLPLLQHMRFPLPIHAQAAFGIRAMHYDEAQGRMQLVHASGKAALPSSGEEGRHIGDWVYAPQRGFTLVQRDPLLENEWLESAQIGELFTRHLDLVKKSLDNAAVHESPVTPKYRLFFDGEHNLHIACDLFEENDLKQEGVKSFGNWVYLPKKGFFLLETPLFSGGEKIISADELSDFIDRHRNWLNGFEGFSTHLFAVEMRLQYALTREGLLFFSELAAPFAQSYIDCGKWVYIVGEGFFPKAENVSAIRAGRVVPKEEIASFINAHPTLEYIKGFFAEHSPVQKSGLDIRLTEEGGISITPHFIFSEQYVEKEVHLFEEYTYVEGEGFCPIPPALRLPPGYERAKLLEPQEEPNFVLYEYSLLQPHILTCARELRHPNTMELHLLRMRQRGKEWLVECTYRTEWGEVPSYALWLGLQQRAPYLLSDAGCILLKHPRWNWLKQITKRQWLKAGRELKLNTLAWMRLNVFEELHLPTDASRASRQTRTLAQQLHDMAPQTAPPCAALQSTLRPYQETGVRWLWFLFTYGLSGLLCDEMGLGKTHQAMALIAAVKQEDPEAKILVICPTSVLYHWEDLLKRFLPALRVSLFYGVGRSLDISGDVLLTSYGIVRSEQGALATLTFTLAIFDEVQSAKNAQSQTHRALRKIQATMRLGLTGTPVENRLLELKALFDLILPGYLPPMGHFKEIFIHPIEKRQDPQSKALLAKLIKPFLLRRKKSEVLLELPEKIEEIAYCTLSPLQQELYRDAFVARRDALLSELSGARSSSYVHIFSLITTLKRICDHPSLITKEFTHFDRTPCGKWDLFVELLHEALDSGHKLVVFSQYLEMLDLIQQYLERERIGYASIRGATVQRKREIARFREDPTCAVFVASLQAAGVGIDLTAGSVVIHYDRWWNPARENQATDRVHRIGQNRGVQVFKLITRNTIEEHIHALIQKKLSLMEGVIGFDEQDYIKGLDREELIEILHAIQESL